MSAGGVHGRELKKVMEKRNEGEPAKGEAPFISSDREMTSSRRIGTEGGAHEEMEGN